MRFCLRHRFAAPPERVARATLEDGYQERLLELPNLGERRVVSLEERPDGTIRRVTFYRLAADLPSAVKRAIGTDQISWDEVATYDPGRREWRFEIRPKVFAQKFEARGRYGFREDAGGTVRDTEVDVNVNVPFVGRLVEKAIGQGLVENMDAEARMLQEYLDGG